MTSKYDILAARWVFSKAGRSWPEGDIARVYVEFETAQGGYCETCSYEYSYVDASVVTEDGTRHSATYDTGYGIDLSDILEGMQELEQENS